MLLLSPTLFEAAFLDGESFSWRARAGIRGDNWVWLESGIGKVNTAMTLAAYAQEHSVEQALLFGIAGAYENSGLAVGDVALADDEIQADLGLEDGGMHAMGFPTLVLGGKLYHNTFPLDHGLTQSLSVRLDIPVKTFLTRDLISESAAEAGALERKWGAQIENMEGAGFAQACLWLGIKGVELRSISNIAGVRDKSQWKMKPAIAALEKAIKGVIRAD